MGGWVGDYLTTEGEISFLKGGAAVLNEREERGIGDMGCLLRWVGGWVGVVGWVEARKAVGHGWVGGWVGGLPFELMLIEDKEEEVVRARASTTSSVVSLRQRETREREREAGAVRKRACRWVGGWVGRGRRS